MLRRSGNFVRSICSSIPTLDRLLMDRLLISLLIGKGLDRVYQQWTKDCHNNTKKEPVTLRKAKFLIVYIFHNTFLSQCSNLNASGQVVHVTMMSSCAIAAPLKKPGSFLHEL